MRLNPKIPLMTHSNRLFVLAAPAMVFALALVASISGCKPEPEGEPAPLRQSGGAVWNMGA